jgi:hypothetical protein
VVGVAGVNVGEAVAPLASGSLRDRAISKIDGCPLERIRITQPENLEYPTRITPFHILDGDAATSTGLPCAATRPQCFEGQHAQKSNRLDKYERYSPISGALHTFMHTRLFSLGT